MPDLRAMFGEAGVGEVKTYVQSGNVVLSSEQPPVELAEQAEQLIGARFGLSIPVIARTRDELAEVVARDPFGAAQVPEKLYQVTFLAHEPDHDLVTRMAALASGTERFFAGGREWYTLHPEGIARSKLATRVSASNLGVRATTRNWTTARTLLAMADEL